MKLQQTNHSTMEEADERSFPWHQVKMRVPGCKANGVLTVESKGNNHLIGVVGHVQLGYYQNII